MRKLIVYFLITCSKVQSWQNFYKKLLTMNFILIFLVNLLFYNCVSSFKLNQWKYFNNYNRFKSLKRKESRINDKFIRYSDDYHIDHLEPRVLLDFIADPAVFVTMLNHLEQMYLTFPFPFGILLKPIVNFFRVPNKRRRRSLFLIKKKDRERLIYAKKFLKTNQLI